MDPKEWAKIQKTARDRATQTGERQKITVGDGPNGNAATIRSGGR